MIQLNDVVRMEKKTPINGRDDPYLNHYRLPAIGLLNEAATHNGLQHKQAVINSHSTCQQREDSIIGN